MTAPLPPTAPGAPADGGTGGQAPPVVQPQPTTPPIVPPGPGAPTTPPATDLATLPEDVRKIISDARAEAARYRTDKQTATQAAAAATAQRDAILRAAGFTPDGKDTPPDTDALTAQVSQQQAVAWTAAVELNVFRTALAAGADAEKLLDSRAFVDTLDAFTEDDVSGPEFRSKLDAHVKAYVVAHPQFKQPAAAGPAAPPRAGSDLPGGNGGAPPTRQPQGLGAAIRAHYGG